MLALTTDNYSMLLVLVPFHIFCVFGLFPFIISQKKFAQQLIKDDIFTRNGVNSRFCSFLWPAYIRTGF